MDTRMAKEGKSGLLNGYKEYVGWFLGHLT
jgi:hypothetical protein